MASAISYQIAGQGLVFCIQRGMIMSEFSYVLSRHVHGKNIRTYALAQYCGLDRSNMYKIINGKRKPTSLEMVRKMARFMHLSPSEERELVEAYQITIAGYDNYFRRKEVMSFFDEFNFSTMSLPVFNYDVEQIDEEAVTFLCSSSEVKQALFHIISTEMSRRGNGHIQMLIQPDASFLLNLIGAESQIGKNIHIEHIICLNNNPETTQSQKNYNLNCLKTVLPLYGNCRNYECFYYYDDISSRTGDLTLFPYMVITSRHVCLLTAGANRGVVMPSSASSQMFTDIFAEYRHRSTVLLKHIENVVKQLEYVESLIQESGTRYCFQMTPCFTPFITPGLAEKYIAENIPGRAQFIARFQEYAKGMSIWSEQTPASCIFSIGGVRRFLESGRIDEYPADVCRTFDMHDRISLVRKLIQACKSMHYRMLKKDIGNPAHELYLFVNRLNGYLMFASPYNGQPVYLNIEEPGLLFTFYDFCENLEDDMFYKPDETESLLNDLIAEIQMIS